MTDNQQPPADMVEAACETFVTTYWDGTPDWDRLPHQSKESFRFAMRAAIAAMQPHHEAEKAEIARIAEGLTEAVDQTNNELIVWASSYEIQGPFRHEALRICAHITAALRILEGNFRNHLMRGKDDGA